MTNPLVLHGRALFHMTHIKNIPGIFKNGILCKNLLTQKKIKFEDVSDAEIQFTRSQITILKGSQYTLHDYVPCFFGARPPMLYAIKGRGILQSDMVYVLVDWNILNFEKTWFTDGNARTQGTNFYQGVANVCHVDFEACQAIYWTDKELRRKKQAEALKFQTVTLDEILGFVVQNDQAESALASMLQAQHVQKKIYLAPEYYY